MLGMKAVTECVCDDFIGQHPSMPGFRQTPYAVQAPCRFEDRLHALIIPSLVSLGK